MSISYLPSGVKISCTLMTVTTPQQLGVSRPKKDVLAKSGSLWLNVDDKKLSATFVCQSPQKFWAGLGTMFLGLAAGIAVVAVAVIVVAAVVGTGGLAGAVLVGLAAGASSAATATIIGGLTVAGGAILIANEIAPPMEVLIGNFTLGHPCDCTLEATSMWKRDYKKTSFDGNYAILQRSVLSCVNGGLLQPFFSPVLAQKAADKFSRNNNDGIELHQEQQLYMGMVSGFTGLADPLGTSFGIVAGVYDYNEGFDVNEGSTSAKDSSGEIDSTVRDEAFGIGEGATTGAIEAVETISSQNRAIIREVMDQGGTYAQGERMTVWGSRTFAGEFKVTGAGIGVGLGFGVAGAVANHYIGESYKKDKLKLIADNQMSNKMLALADASNGTNVVSEP